MIVSLWNLTGISAALLPRYLLNFRAIGKVQTRISRLRDFTRSCGKTSYRLVNGGPEVLHFVQSVILGPRPEYSNRTLALQWRHNEPDGISNHRRLEYLLNRLFRRISKKTSKLRVTCLCEGNPPVTGGFPEQRSSNAEYVLFDDVIMVILLGWGSPGSLRHLANTKAWYHCTHPGGYYWSH